MPYILVHEPLSRTIACNKYLCTYFTILGIGYTIGLLRFGTEIRNVMIASLSMIAIADILLHDKHVERIRQCMIGKHVQKSCLVMYPQKNHTMECPRGAKRKDIFFSTQFYFR